MADGYGRRSSALGKYGYGSMEVAPGAQRGVDDDSRAASTLSGDESVDLREFDEPHPPDPLELLGVWLAQADARHVREPRALALATVDEQHRPASRIVLVKEVNASGILFTTHLSSRKSQHLAQNRFAAGTFYWRETLQQINIVGRAVPAPTDEADRLFRERPLDARAATAASRQSEVLEDERELQRRAADLARRQDALRRPPHWGAFRLVPDIIEFWHGRRTRLHRRLEYQRDKGTTWTARRLQP